VVGKAIWNHAPQFAVAHCAQSRVTGLRRSDRLASMRAACTTKLPQDLPRQLLMIMMALNDLGNALRRPQSPFSPALNGSHGP
jgi:hypothetical protein